MKRKNATILGLISLATVGMTTAQEYLSCDKVLVTRNVSDIREHSREQLAWFRLITQDNYEEAKKAASAEYVGQGYFNGDYNEFNKKRASLYDELNYRRDRESARSIMTSSVPSGAIDAWRQCMSSANKGLFSYVSDESPTGATVTVVWAAPPGLPVIDVTADINGEPITKSRLSGDWSFSVRRQQRKEEIRGVINGVASGGNYATKFLVPPRIETTVTQIEDAGDIPKSYMVEGEKVSVVSVGTENGDIVGKVGCTAPLPAGYFIEVTKDNPRVQAKPTKYPNTYLLGRIEPPGLSGEQREVCFLTQCGQASGKYTACTGELIGTMKKRVTKIVEQ